MGELTEWPVTLLCGCTHKADHISGERLIHCHIHKRSFIVKANRERVPNNQFILTEATGKFPQHVYQLPPKPGEAEDDERT